MITINTVSATQFSFNGINYHKNFMPFVVGNKVSIINVYDGCIGLTGAPTIFSDYIVDGTTYTSVGALQIALLDVIYTRNSLTPPISGAITGSLTSGYLPKATGTTTLGNSLIYDNGTNVAIGTTSPSAKLHLTGANELLRLQSDNGYIQWFDNANTNALGYIGANASAYSIIAQSGSAPLILGTNLTERMRITSGGNVGIGTTSPTTGLVVNSRIQVTGNSSPSSGTGLELFYDGTGAGTLAFARGTGYIPNFMDGSQLQFFTNSTERLRITSGGNVGINTTSPSEKLHVVGNGLFSGSVTASNGTLVGGSGVSNVWTGTQSAYDAIATKSSTTIYFIQ